MNDNIEEGDYVRHVNPIINGGAQMTVQKMNDYKTQALCSHFSGAEAIHREDWFPVSDLILMRKVEGGFI